MTDIYNSNDLFQALKTIIDLPDEIVDLRLHMTVRNLPTLELTTYVSPRNVNGMLVTADMETKTFRIIPNDTENEYMQGLQELAERVTLFDWSDNDADAVKTIDDMRLYLDALKTMRRI